MQAAFLVSFGRYVLPILAFYIIVGCGVSLVRGNKKTGTIGYLINTANGDEIPLTNYETAIGRSNACDIVLGYSTVSRFHAVIAKRGSKWMVFDTNSKTGTFINEDQVIEKGFLEDGDTVIFGNAPFKFVLHLPKNRQDEEFEDEEAPIYIADQKFYTDEIVIPKEALGHTTLKNCITGDELSIDGLSNVLIGRSEEAVIHIASPAVSRNHALISLHPEGFILEDLNSSAGTILNGEPVTECKVLHDGDIIEVCGFTIKFSAE